MTRPRFLFMLLSLVPWASFVCAQDAPAPPDHAVVLYDAASGVNCVEKSTANDCTQPPPPPPPTLPLQAQVALRVLHSPLLSRYVLHWGSEGVGSAGFPVLAGGPVQWLSLDLPAPSATKVELEPGVTKWTANTILSSLLDPGTSAAPEIDLDHQHRALTAKQHEVQSEILAFQDLYEEIVSKPGTAACNLSLPRSGFHLAQCLRQAYLTPPPAMTRQQFLVLAAEWHQRFNEVQGFAREFDADHMGARMLELESSIHAYNEEAETFHDNVWACKDAYSLVMDMRGTHPSAAALAARLQIRARLATEAGASASAPASLLEREILADAEIAALRDSTSLASGHLEKMHESCKNLTAIGEPFAADLVGLRANENYLPLLVKSINDVQALAVAMLNELYEKTTIGPVDSLYSTGFEAKEKPVSYTIGVIDQFTPYTMVRTLPAEGAMAHESIVANGSFTVPAP